MLPRKRVDHARPDQGGGGRLPARQLAVLNGRYAHIATVLAEAVEHDDLPAEDRKKIREPVTYLSNKAEHLHYNTALEHGWPIATSIIEGARCATRRSVTSPV